MCHYNYRSLEIYHYYSSYCKCTIIISIFLKICHYLAFQCIYKNIWTKIAPTFHPLFLFIFSTLSMSALLWPTDCSLSQRGDPPLAALVTLPAALSQPHSSSVLGSSRPPTSCSAACERRQDGRGGDGAGYAGEGGRDDARAEDGGCAAARDDARGVVALLRPTQAVHFLAAAKLHLAVHEFFFVTSLCMNSGATRMVAPATPQP